MPVSLPALVLSIARVGCKKRQDYFYPLGVFLFFFIPPFFFLISRTWCAGKVQKMDPLKVSELTVGWLQMEIHRVILLFLTRYSDWMLFCFIVQLAALKPMESLESASVATANSAFFTKNSTLPLPHTTLHVGNIPAVILLFTTPSFTYT